MLGQDNSFSTSSRITSISDAPIIITLPVVGDMLSSEKNGCVKLLKEIASGGEGTVYETDTPFVAKIYLQGNLTQRKIEKLRLILSKTISYKGICFPVDVLYNGKNEFVGYLMPKAHGKKLKPSFFIKPEMKQIWPDWTRKDLVELCLTILKKIKFLHSRNIIIGDINPRNILLVNSEEVYFIDTDSYQVEGFPCPVGQTDFTAPELQGKRFENCLRTLGNEYFAVAVLLFELMLPGKFPYDQKEGGSQIENIRNMNFPYPLNENIEDTPDGPWRFCWSHLTYKIKEAFYQTFMKGEPHSLECNRINVKEWIALFDEYKYLLVSGKFLEQDPMSLEIFPTRFKRNRKYNYITCKICNEEFPEYQIKSGICKSCLNKSFDGGTHYCERCRKEIPFTNYDYYIKKLRFKKCSECFEYGRREYKSKICVDCGEPFIITNDEHEMCEKKGWKERKRCNKCKGAKK